MEQRVQFSSDGLKLTGVLHLPEGLKKGERADYLKNQLAVNQIRRLYEEKGYEMAEVYLEKGGNPGETHVVLRIFEGPKCQLRPPILWVVNPRFQR